MYSVVYFVNNREVSAQAVTWQQALARASREAIKPDHRTPVVILDDARNVIHKIG